MSFPLLPPLSSLTLLSHHTLLSTFSYFCSIPIFGILYSTETSFDLDGAVAAKAERGLPRHLEGVPQNVRTKVREIYEYYLCHAIILSFIFALYFFVVVAVFDVAASVVDIYVVIILITVIVSLSYSSSHCALDKYGNPTCCSAEMRVGSTC